MYLGKASGKVEHYRYADNTWEALKRANLSQTGGMLPTYFNLNTGQPVDSRLSVGGMADSGHEYLIKQYLMTAKTDKTVLEMCPYPVHISSFTILISIPRPSHDEPRYDSLDPPYP